MILPAYPRTLHLGDSGGGQSKHHCPFAEVAGRHLVVEEKVDGSHCGLGFDTDAELRVFSRNTVLDAPPVQPDFQPLDALARAELDALWDVLGPRYVLYGEWAHATHSIFYDGLPAFFLEDDIFDRQADRFLSTARRRALVERLPVAFRSAVAVLFEGAVLDMTDLHALVGPSRYKTTAWRERCRDLDAVEDSDLMEGLYIKLESDDFVERRLKWIRPGFLAHVAGSGRHWRDRARQYNTSN